MTAWLKAHAKALAAFVTMEAGQAVTILQDPHPSPRMIAIAFLLPIAGGLTVHKVTNQATP